MSPFAAFARYPLARWASLTGLGFTTASQARRVLNRAESSSSSCGLVSHLRLLPTPPHGDAVTFGFQAGERMPGEDLNLSERVRLRAHGALASRRLFSSVLMSFDVRECFTASFVAAFFCRPPRPRPQE